MLQAWKRWLRKSQTLTPMQLESRSQGITERLIELCSMLVRFKTVAANVDEMIRCADWIQGYVWQRQPTLIVKRYVSSDKPSLLLTYTTAPPKILLAGHLDVDNIDETRHPQAFTATQFVSEEGHLCLSGRGTADMKGPIAAMLDLFLTTSLPHVGLLLTFDEEIGGENGTGYVVTQLDWLPQVVILPDGGANLHIVTDQKGLLRLRYITHSRGAHAARPWLGENALVAAVESYQTILQHYPLPQGEEDWRTSVTLTQLNDGTEVGVGGNAVNSVPAYAIGTLDIRYVASGADEGPRLTHEIRDLISRFDTDVITHFDAPAFHLDPTSTAIQLLQTVAHDVLGHSIPLTKESGASDARYFGNNGIPVLMFQPTCAGWHTAHEWVDIESLITFQRICALFIRNVQ